jgi:hypothetical protein
MFSNQHESKKYPDEKEYDGNDKEQLLQSVISFIFYKN